MKIIRKLQDSIGQALLVYPKKDAAFSDADYEKTTTRFQKAGYNIVQLPRVESALALNVSLRESLTKLSSRIRRNSVEYSSTPKTDRKYQYIILAGHGSPQSITFGDPNNELTTENVSQGEAKTLNQLLNPDGGILLLSCSAAVEKMQFSFRDGFYIEENIAQALAISTCRKVLAAVHDLGFDCFQLEEGRVQFRQKSSGIYYHNGYRIDLHPLKIKTTLEEYLAFPSIVKKILEHENASALSDSDLKDMAETTFKMFCWRSLSHIIHGFFKKEYAIGKRRVFAEDLVTSFKRIMKEPEAVSRHQLLDSTTTSGIWKDAFARSASSIIIINGFLDWMALKTRKQDQLNSCLKALELPLISLHNCLIVRSALASIPGSVEIPKERIKSIYKEAKKNSFNQLYLGILEYAANRIKRCSDVSPISSKKLIKIIKFALDERDHNLVKAVIQLLELENSKKINLLIFMKLVQNGDLENFKRVAKILFTSDVKFQMGPKLLPIILNKCSSEGIYKELIPRIKSSKLTLEGNVYIKMLGEAIEAGNYKLVSRWINLPESILVRDLYSSITPKIVADVLRIIFDAKAEKFHDFDKERIDLILWLSKVSSSIPGAIEELSDSEVHKYIMAPLFQFSTINLSILKGELEGTESPNCLLKLAMKLMECPLSSNSQKKIALEYLVPKGIPDPDLLKGAKAKRFSRKLIDLASVMNLGSWLPIVVSIDSNRNTCLILDKYVSIKAEPSPSIFDQEFRKYFCENKLKEPLSFNKSLELLEGAKKNSSFGTMQIVFSQWNQSDIFRTLNAHQRKKAIQEIKHAYKLFYTLMKTRVHVQVMDQLLQAAVKINCSLKLSDTSLQYVMQIAQEYPDIEIEKSLFQYIEFKKKTISNKMLFLILKLYGSTWKKKLPLGAMLKYLSRTSVCYSEKVRVKLHTVVMKNLFKGTVTEYQTFLEKKPHRLNKKFLGRLKILVCQ